MCLTSLQLTSALIAMLAACTIDFLERKFRTTYGSNMLMATHCMLCFVDVTYNLLDSLTTRLYMFCNVCSVRILGSFFAVGFTEVRF